MRTTGTHRPRGLAPWVVAALLFTGVPPSAFPDTIFLKNGQTITTDRCWVNGDVISFAVDNLVATVPRNEVERIEAVPSESSSATDAPPGTAETPPGRQTEYLSRIIKAVNKTEKAVGFRGLFWDCRVQDIHGLQSIGTDPAFGGIDNYANPEDDLKFGTTNVERVVYGFWRGNLLSITLWVQGKADYESLREEAFRRFGRGLQGDDRSERYVWPGGPSDKYLEYNEALDRGLLWFRNSSLWRRIASTD